MAALTKKSVDESAKKDVEMDEVIQALQKVQ